jgi:anti-sigma factor RsiW
MTTKESPVSEDELHAYVDGELPADRGEAVAAWLAAHPEEAALVAAWRAQADAIRARYATVAAEPVPARLKLETLLRNDRGAGRYVMEFAAASLAAFVIGAGAGWFAHGTAEPARGGFAAMTADAIEAYKLYVVEVRHPVEVPGDQRAHMTQWLSKRLGYALSIPDLQSLGLKLVGGRLLPGPIGEAAAFYMYEGPSGERFTLYCAKAAAPQMTLRYMDEKYVGAFYWVDDKIGYVVSGPADRARLEQITRTVYEQLDKGAAKKS